MTKYPKNIIILLPIFLTAIPIGLQLLGDQWVGELATSFRVYYLLPLVACLIFYSLQRKWLLAAMAVCLALANFMIIFPLLLQSAKRDGDANLAVAQVNVENKNRNFDPLLRWLDKVNPDVIAVEELTPAWDMALRKKLVNYNAYSLPRVDCFGIGLFSKLPIDSVDVLVPVGAEPSLIAHLSRNHVALTVIAVHTLAPHRPNELNHRNEQLEQLSKAVCKQALPKVLLGDLNTVPWSNTFRRFAQCIGMSDSRYGFGLLASCLVKGVLWVPIDYCLVSPEVKVVDVSAGPAVGSDHVPLLAKLAVP